MKTFTHCPKCGNHDLHTIHTGYGPGNDEDLQQWCNAPNCDWSHRERDNSQNDPDTETMTCDLCGKVEIEYEAIETGWIPSYWKEETEILNPVCRECATARTKCLDGESVLIQKPAPLNLKSLVDRLNALTAEHERLENEYADRASSITDEQINQRQNEIYVECFEIAKEIVTLTRN